jgi:cyclic pyranopterin phosphate synthase
MKKTRLPLSTHLTPKGEVRMVDVGKKEPTARTGVAVARVEMAPATIERLRAGDTPKGDVLATVRVAGIQAAKRTPDLIPLAHVIGLTKVEIDVQLDDAGARITCTAEARDRTGVEMEAMVGASAAALTLYDMLKGIDRAMTITVLLAEKRGGKSGTWVRGQAQTESLPDLSDLPGDVE